MDGKAYSIFLSENGDKYEFFGIYFGETSGAAAESCLYNLNYDGPVRIKGLLVKREEWADQYKQEINIPDSEFFSHGYPVSCWICGKHIREKDPGTVFARFGHAICYQCFEDHPEHRDGAIPLCEYLKKLGKGQSKT